VNWGRARGVSWRPVRRRCVSFSWIRGAAQEAPRRSRTEPVGEHERPVREDRSLDVSLPRRHYARRRTVRLRVSATVVASRRTSAVEAPVRSRHG